MRITNMRYGRYACTEPYRMHLVMTVAAAAVANTLYNCVYCIFVFYFITLTESKIVCCSVICSGCSCTCAFNRFDFSVSFIYFLNDCKCWYYRERSDKKTLS